jgi:cytochrome c oxidase assembly protein subunit 15
MFVAAWVVLLIFFGGQVKSTESGLSVPDWPNTYGHFMFSFPWEKMVGGIFWEHSHRMIASVAGLLTVLQTIWIYRVDKRRWVGNLAAVTTLSVAVQGVLGGLTVHYLLPVWLSSSHGMLGQIYLCLSVCLALVLSPRWEDNPVTIPDFSSGPLRRLTLATTAVIFLQLIIGALMRHSDAGLAIPDFPTMFGSWVPPLSEERLAAANHALRDFGILTRRGLREVTFWEMASHLLHRFWALVVTFMVIWTARKAYKLHPVLPELRRPALLLVALLTVQVTLGILTILTEKQFTITSLHVVNGALTLATSLVLTVRARHLLHESAAVQTSASPAVAGGTVLTDEVPA